MFDDIKALFIANLRADENSDEALKTFMELLNLMLLGNLVADIVRRRLRQDVLFVYLLGYDEAKELLNSNSHLDMNNSQTVAQIEQIMQKQMIVAQTTQTNLFEFIAKIRDEISDVKKARKQINEFIDSQKKGRSQTIAQTLVSQSFEAAKLYAFIQNGVVNKMWSSELDERVRETHLIAHGQVVPTLDVFQVGADALLYPGDPNGSPEEVINCRCTIVPA